MSIFSQNIETATQIARTMRGSEFWEQIVEKHIQFGSSINDNEFYIQDSCLRCKHYGEMLRMHLDLDALYDIRRLFPEISELDFSSMRIDLKPITEIYGNHIGINHITACLVCTDARLIDSMKFEGLQLNLFNPYLIRNSVFKNKIIFFDSLFSWPNFIDVNWDGVEEIRFHLINPPAIYEPFQHDADFWRKIVRLEIIGSISSYFRITVPPGFSVSRMFRNFPSSIKTIRIENSSYVIIFERKQNNNNVQFHPNVPNGRVQTLDRWNAYICL